MAKQEVHEWLSMVLAMGTTRVDLYETRGKSPVERVTYWENFKKEKSELEELGRQMLETARTDSEQAPLVQNTYALFAYVSAGSQPVHRYWIKLGEGDAKAPGELEPQAQAHASLAQVNVQLLRTITEMSTQVLRSTQGRDEHWERLLTKSLERVETLETTLSASQKERETQLMRSVERETLSAQMRRAEKNDDYWFDKANTYLPLLASKLLAGKNGATPTPAALEALFAMVPQEITPEEVEAFSAALEELDVREKIKVPFLELFMMLLRKRKRALNAPVAGAAAPGANGTAPAEGGDKPS
jgi:hypothetical protein